MKKTLLLLLICALSFSAWGTTVVKTVPDLATAYSWQDKSNPFYAYQSFKLDDNITVTANSNTTAGTSTGNMNGIYSGGKWYVYAVDNNGSFTISAKEGYIIQTISIQYGVGNNGVLSSKITATPPTATADQITTGTPVVVNASSATFYVGNTGNSTAGRLTINAFAVTYCLSSAIGDKTYTEKFDSCGTTGSSYVAGPSSIVGDNGVYKWKLTSYRRQPGASSDEINGEQGIRINYGGSIASDGNLEGGIKSVAFNWHPTSGSLISDFYVKVGAESYHHSCSAVSGTFPFSQDFNVTKNTTLSIEVASKIGTSGQAYQVIGPVTITPYLLFRSKSYEYDYSAKQSLALSDIIINNTGTTTPSYAISGGAQATLFNGVVTFAEEEETFTITATWGDVSTTTNITVHALPHPTFTIADVVATMYDGTATPNPVVKVDDVEQSNPVITYASSDENIVKVENEGKELSILAAGEVTITANLVASADYQAATTTFTLTVSGITEDAAKVVTEEFGDLTPAYSSWSSNTVPATIQGDHNPYEWTVLYYKYDDTKDDLKVNGNAGVMLASNSSGHIAATMGENIPMEGGIKAVGFDWMVYTGKNAISFAVTAGNVTKNVSYTGKTAGDKGRFEGAFEQKSNVNFQLTNTGINDVYGPITIVPYLLYTTKNAEASAVNGAYTNTDLINNTTGTAVEYSLEDNEEEATIDTETGAVTILKEGQVKVVASWGEVSTSYILTTHAKPIPEVSFANAVVAKDLMDGSFVNVLTKTAGSGNVGYTSSRPDVASVADDGTITLHMIGSTTITANVLENDNFAAASTDYELNVTYTPVENTYFKETFVNCGEKPITNKDTLVEGLNGVYDWSIKNFQRWSQNDQDMVGGELGIRVRYEGHIAMNESYEGGIKAVAFKWHPTNTNTPQLQVSAGDVQYLIEKKEVATAAANEYQFARLFGKQSNVQLSIENIGTDAAKSPYVIVGPITIVPYLLYTEKEVSINPLENSTYTNTAIINNIPEGGTVTYSIENQGQTEVDAIAVINAETGEVTMKSAGTVKVIATWGDVTTSYLLTIELPTPVISGLVATTIDLDGGSYTPSLTATIGGQPIEDADFELKSSDSTKAIVQEGTFVPVASGSAKMTATLKAGTFQGFAYKSVSLSNISLTINAYTPEDNFVETFSNLGNGESTATTEFNGDNNVYTWSAHNYTKSNDAIVINTADGSLSSNGAQEGGIKYMTFKWIASEKATESMGFVVTMNDEASTYHFATAQGTSGYTWERMFNAKQNSQFSIGLEESSSKGVKIMNSQVTIVPYLLYTEKEATIEVGQTFTNEALINNLGEETITYSIVEGSQYATIDGDEITAIAEGDVVVKASWNEDQIYTTYNLHINPMPTLVISEDDEDLAELVEEKDGETLDITLKRTMEADGAYSTIFLPFAMNATQIAAVFGEGTQVAQLLSSESADDVLTFNFDFVNEMNACVPYLINPTQNVTEANIANVTIVKPEEPVTVEGGKFHGILAKQEMDITGLYFLGDDNVLVTYSEIQTPEVQGLRAYFTLANPTPQLVARCVIGHTHPTILPLVDGKPVNGVKKVIMNNQMIIIRNTDMYNAQGIKIQ